MTIHSAQHASDAGLLLLFAKGKRPDRAAVYSFAGRLPFVAVSHDPESTTPGDPRRAGRHHWLELLRDGLTFDLIGIAPGPARLFRPFEHRFDLPDLPTPEGYDAVVLKPGPHIVSSGNSLPVIRALLALGCDLVRQFEDLAAIGWDPSCSAIGRRYFQSVMTSWLDGGPFPALGLTAFVETRDGALDSMGLKFWIGQELRIEPPLSADRVAATRLGIRLINQLVIMGGLDADELIISLDGSPLVLRRSLSRAVISVWRE